MTDPSKKVYTKGLVSIEAHGLFLAPGVRPHAKYAQHHPFTYDYLTAAALMEQHHLPREYSGTLRSGLWDNCEILPPEETTRQGIPLSLEYV